ncbi:hypothetical protein ACJ6X8_02420 [Pseudomonas alvandae]|uniref:hypothetical protein n=1 Tax=Pseudomonas TaxID=286 RepID=UPI00389AA0B0
MSVQKKIERNLLGEAGDLLTSTWPSQWTRRAPGNDDGADLVYVMSPDIQRRFVYLYGAAEASIEFDLPVDLNLTAEDGYQVRFLYQPTQRSSENPKVRAYFNARAHYWEYELHTSNMREGVEQPRDWLTCDETIVLNNENNQPKAVLAFQSGLFDPSSPDVDITSGPENDQPVAQEPGWPGGRGELHFSGKAQGSDVAPEVAFGVSLFLHLKPLQLTTDQPMPELDGVSARYWVEKDGRAYMPICRGGGTHHLDLPVAEDCGWAGGGVYKGTSAYASFTNQDEAGQAWLQVTPTEPDDDDDAQPIATGWEIRNDGDAGDASVDGKTATLRFESVYHAPPHETLACIVGPYKLDIVRHILRDFWPSVAEDETIDLHVKVRYTVSDEIEPGIDVQWRHDDELLTTIPTRPDGWSAYVYQPTGDAQLVATIDSPYKSEADRHAQVFDIKTIPTRKWAQFELSVDGEEISPDDPWLILPGQSYELKLKPSSDSVLTGEDLTLTVDQSRLQVEPTQARTLVEDGLTWTVTTSSDDIGDFTLSLDCVRFKQSPTWTGTTNRLPALTIAEADGNQLDPLAAVANLTAVVPHYDDMRSTDQISVTWTGATGSPEEGSHSTVPVEVGTVGQKTIELPVGLIAYALGKPVTVTYTVTRGSTSLPAPDSLTLNVSALLENALMPSQPRILEADQSGELDIGSFSGNARVRIEGWPHIAAGQYVWLRLKGTKVDGSYEKTIWKPPSKVTQSEFNGNVLNATVIETELKELKDGSTLTIEFKVAFDKSEVEAQATSLPSRTYTIRSAFNATAPGVKQATGSGSTQQLDPVAAKNELTVVIPDYGILSGDEVSVTWAGSTGGGSLTTEMQALPDNCEIEIPVSVIAYNLGRSVTVTYIVKRSSGVKPPSAALTLAVATLAESALMPSQPRILEADQSGELDIGTLSGNARVRIEGWPHIAAGQYVWLRLKGTKVDGSYEKTIWKPPSKVTQSEFNDNALNATVIETELKELKDGSTLTIEFKVAFDKSEVEAQATSLPSRTYTIRSAFNATAPGVKQATGSGSTQQLDPVAAKNELTVVIPDYGIQSGDEVSVTWAGSTGGGSLTTEMQALPGNREIEIPVSVIAYNLGRSVTVTYIVKRSSGVKPPSAALTLAVATLAESALMPSQPRILEADQSGELDIGSLWGNARVRIEGWPHIAAGQYVWLRLKGTKVDGSYEKTIWKPPSKVTQSEFNGNALNATVIDTELKELKDGSTLTIEFKVAFDKSEDEVQATPLPSRTYTIRSAFYATAPGVKQAMGSAPFQLLNPMEAKDALTVVIPDYGIQHGDQVSVIWAGAPGGGSPTTAWQALPDNREIEMPVSVIAFNLGRPVGVTYIVKRTSGVKPQSSGLLLTVGTLANSALMPSRPRILLAADNGNGDELYIKNVLNKIEIQVDNWPHIAIGQHLWMRLKGYKADGAEHNHNIWIPPGPMVSEIWLTQGYYRKSEISKYLLELGDGSTLTVEFKVAFGQITDETQATDFPPRTYTVKNPLTFMSIKDHLGREIQENGITEFPMVSLWGRASVATSVDLYDNLAYRITISVSSDGAWRVIPSFGSGEHRLYVRSSNGGSPLYSNTRTFNVAPSASGETETDPEDPPIFL